MGSVWSYCHPLPVDRPVAVKVLRLPESVAESEDTSAALPARKEWRCAGSAIPTVAVLDAGIRRGITYPDGALDGPPSLSRSFPVAAVRVLDRLSEIVLVE